MHDLPSADRDYEAFRREYERRIDDDYVAWRRRRFGAGFEAWRRERQRAAASMSGGDAPHDESPLQSLGRAVSETVIGAPR
jgi:hypothetical protein